MNVPRPRYLERLASRRDNGMIKVVTGIRRCGKSWLLFNQYYRHLLDSGVEDSHILRIALDDERFEDLADRKKLGAFVRERVRDDGRYYLFLDEIQFVDGFEKVLNGLARMENLDIYVTGSNSKFLSTDVLTEFRGRGDEVRVRPFSFAEFRAATGLDRAAAWAQYSMYGGLPQVAFMKTAEQKASFLTHVFAKVYIDDIVERNGLRGDEAMTALCRIAASSVGSLTSPSKLARSFASGGFRSITDKTVSQYLGHLCNAYLIEKAERYDIKGKKYISTPCKYYYCDPGVRNAALSFRQYEETHLMENVVFSELLSRGFCVDVGIVTRDERDDGGRIHRRQLEVDFVAGMGGARCYVQSAFAIPDADKMRQESDPLRAVPDSFRKIIVVGGEHPAHRTEDGILVMGLFDFLEREDSITLEAGM